MSKTGKIEVINDNHLRQLYRESIQSKRRRINYNLHNLDDPYQRFINAINMGSYMRPHKHKIGDDETFIILQGACLVVVFNDKGVLIETHLLSHSRGHYVVDIVGGIWHTLLALLDGTAIMEVKTGPYNPDTAKEFAPWAPDESELRNSVLYLDQLFNHKIVRACLCLHEFY